jgi:hypothetical protein
MGLKISHIAIMLKKLRNLREPLYKMQTEALYKKNQQMDRVSSITNKQ